MISSKERLANYTLLLLFAAIVLFPVLWLLLTALSTSTAGADLGSLDVGNFAAAWTEAGFGRYLASSAIISVATVTATAVLSVLSGYAFGVLGVVGGRVLFPLILAGIMVPLEAIIVPLYFDFRGWGLTDSYPGLILAHVGLSVSFGTFWMRATFRAMPPGLIEAAELDGASAWSVLWRVLVPLARPAVVTLVLLVFMWTWNDYFLALVLVADPQVQPATLALGTFQGRYSTQVNLLAAAAVIISVPVVGLYVFFQRHFIHGVLSGAFKD